MIVTNMFASALKVTALSVCTNHIGELFAIVETVNARFDLTRISLLFGVLSALFGKCLYGYENIATYKHEFQSPFIQLERMGLNVI